VLHRELGVMWEFFNHCSVRLPLNPSLEVVGIDCKVTTYVDHILHRDQFWAISIASGSVRLWDLRSCCMMLSHVMQGHPRGLFQSSGGTVDRILLAFVLSSILAVSQKGSAT